MKFCLISLCCIASLYHLASAQPVKDFSLKKAEAIGKELYLRDNLAAIATDLMLAQGLDLSEYPLRGWVTELKGKTSVVTFVGDYDGEYRGVFEVRKKGKKPPVFLKILEQELTAYQLAAFTARMTATAAIEEPCSDRYNMAVLKDRKGDGFLAYALAATTDPDAVVAGGHYRVKVSADGKEILRVEKLSASCLVLDKSPDDMPEGASLAALSMSHIVSERPLEIHVFLNYLHRITLYVMTKDESIWKIEDGRLDKVQ